MAGRSAGPATEAVSALARSVVPATGLVVEDVTITPAGRRRVVRVTVDLPEDARGGVPMDSVAAASQVISQALDSSNVLGEQPYVLEVSSPGVDRPLLERRHFRRARGRLVTVTGSAGQRWAGRLHEADDEGLLLDDARIAWADVVSGRVEVEFGRVDGVDADGEDDRAEPDVVDEGIDDGMDDGIDDGSDEDTDDVGGERA